MKKLFVSIFVIISITISLLTSSCKDNVDDNYPSEKVYYGTLTHFSLEDLNNFHANGYTIITGDLRIEYFDSIKDMSLFSNLKRVYGNVDILVNNELESLVGLNNLDSILGSFVILNCKKIKNLEGLESLKYVGSDFRIMTNESLTNLQGINNLNFVGIKFKVSSNPNLNSLDGLNSLKTIAALEIGESYGFGNNKLESIEALSNLEEITLRLEINRNPRLKVLTGFQNLSKVGVIKITHNDSLTDFCSLDNVIRTGGFTGGIFKVESNSYNPTLEDMKNGNCSQ